MEDRTVEHSSIFSASIYVSSSKPYNCSWSPITFISPPSDADAGLRNETGAKRSSGYKCFGRLLRPSSLEAIVILAI